MPKSFNDTLTVTGAHDLCRRLRTYWESRGRHDLRFDVRQEVGRKTKNLPASLYVVRSNMRFSFAGPCGKGVR